MADVAEKTTGEVVDKDVEISTESTESKVAVENAGTTGTPAAEVAEAATEVTATEEAAATEAPAAADEAPAKASNGDAADHTAKDDVGKLERQIIRQIEYYFGDANMRRDKFLKDQISKSEGGWVPMATLMTFKRLSDLSSDVDKVVAALAKSDEGLVEISEDKTKVRRHPERPLPEYNDERRKELMTRTLYLKGFPLDITMDQLLPFFNRYDGVDNVVIRKYHDKESMSYKPKGSVFIQFINIEKAKAFLDMEDIQYEKTKLIKKWQENYLADKREEDKARLARFKKVKKDTSTPKVVFPKGSVLHFVDADDTVTRETLRECVEAVEDESKIAYIDFRKGDTAGHIRFHDENAAVKVLEKIADKKLKLGDDVELTLRILEKDEEEQYLEKAAEDMRARRSTNKGNYHGRKRRGGGGGGIDFHKKRQRTSN